MKDKGTGAENLIWLASRQGGRAHPSSLAADDILAGLTGRIAELEARVSAILAEVEPEPPRVDSESGALSATKADVSRGTDKMSRDARVEADAELTRASEERRMLATEMRLLREAFQEARSSQLSAGAGTNAIERQIPPDVRAAIADEMRSLLTQLLADFRAQAAPPPLTAAVVGTTQAVVATPHVPEQLVEDVDTVPPVADRAATIEAPIETVESVIEPIDEPIVDEDVEDLRASEPIAPTGALEVRAAEPITPLVHEYKETPPWIETEGSAGIVEDTAAPLDAIAAIIAEPIPEPLERAPLGHEDVEQFVRADPPAPIEAIEVSPAPAERLVEEFVDELPKALAAPWSETIEPSAALAEQFEAIVPEYVEEQEVTAPEPIEHVAPEYVAQPERAIDFAIIPPVLPATPDPRIQALWNAATPASLPVEIVPPPAPEPNPFVGDELIADTGSLEMPVAPLLPPFEFEPEPPVQFTPEPIVEFAPEARIEFAPEPTPVSPPPFPELKIADEAGLHQIQIVISPIHSFSRLLETEARIRALSTVNALHLRDFRNGVATFAVAVGEAISPAEFGAVIQMLQELHLRLEGTTQTTVELRAEDEPTAS